MRATSAKESRGTALPNSSARIEPTGWDRQGEVAQVCVRCGCGKRLFDLVARRGLSYDDAGMYHSGLGHVYWCAERLCPRCRVKHSREVTIVRGTPMGEGGPWICQDGHDPLALARLDAARGRISVKCRCGEVVSINADEALRVARTITPRAARIPQPSRDEFDDSDLDDVPF